MAFKIEEDGDINKVFQATEDKLELATKAIAMELFKNVILKTPVDTGRARGNWTCSLEVPSDEVSETVDKNGNESIGKVVDEVEKAKLGQKIYLSNNLPYIAKLEYGSSGQAPEGMVRISLQEIESQFKDIIK